MARGSLAPFTVDELIGVAGVAKGSFYNHFPDKEAIAEAVHREVREMEEAEVRAVNREIADPVSRIARGMALYARMALSSPEDAQLLTLRQIDRRFLQSGVNAGLRDDLQAALCEARIVAPSIETAALLVIGQTAVLITRLRSETRPDEAQLIALQCIAITLVGLGLSQPEAQSIATQAVDSTVPTDGSTSQALAPGN